MPIKSEVCYYCGKVFIPKQYNTGRHTKHFFCCREHLTSWVKQEKPKEKQKLCKVCWHYFPRDELNRSFHGMLCKECFKSYHERMFKRKVIDASSTVS